jgi:hypothetical protein
MLPLLTVFKTASSSGLTNFHLYLLSELVERAVSISHSSPKGVSNLDFSAVVDVSQQSVIAAFGAQTCVFGRRRRRVRNSVSGGVVRELALTTERIWGRAEGNYRLSVDRLTPGSFGHFVRDHITDDALRVESRSDSSDSSVSLLGPQRPPIRLTTCPCYIGACIFFHFSAKISCSHM